MFEILEHTADIGFRAQAPTLPALFESAAEALVNIAMETGEIAQRETYPLAADGGSLESLLVNWLNEVLYRLDGEWLAMRTFRVTAITDTHVSGEALGEPRDPARHNAKLIVKGVTYHQLKIAQDDHGWFCEVYLDI